MTENKYEEEFRRLEGLRAQLRQINRLIDQREATIAGIQRLHADLRANWDQMADDDIFSDFTPDYDQLDRDIRTASIAATDRDQLVAAYNEIYRGCQQIETALQQMRAAEAGDTPRYGQAPIGQGQPDRGSD